MALIVVGTNHRYSPLSVRERISFSRKRLGQALLFLKEKRSLKGAVILSTCNRVELYASTEDLKEAILELEGFICFYHEISREKISPYLYVHKEKEAARHLFLVASGLDSLILGETQITGQVKYAFSEAEGTGFMDRFLKKIFHSAFCCAKKIRNQTRITEGKVSVASVTLDFIKKKLGTVAGKNILIIGAGKVTELVLRHLEKEASNAIFVSNRTFGRAKELASRIKAKAVRFDRLKQFLKKADVIISATASPHFVVKKEMLENILNSKLLIIDLALPRDVEPGVKDIEGVELFCLEDLETVIRENRDKKAQEAKRAKEIIDIEVEELWKEVIKLEQEPAPLH